MSLEVATDQRVRVREALEALGIRNLLVGLHDAAFPGRPEEDVGRGTPYSRGAADFLEFVATLGFGGVQLGPQGILFASAHAGARAIAKAVKAAGFPVLLVDNNRGNAAAARLEGLPAAYMSVLSEDALDAVSQGGLGRLLALTPDDEVNALAALHFREVFGRAEVYQLPPRKGGSPRVESAAPHLRGRYLFAPGVTYDALDERFAAGQVVKTTKLSPEFDWAAFRERYGEDALPLFVVTEAGALQIAVADKPPSPKGGQTVIGLVSPPAERATPPAPATAGVVS